MKFFIDSANVDEIKEINEWGVLSGVTTNPTLVAKENADFIERLRAITSIVPGSVSAEVVATDAEGMIKEGEELAAVAQNVTVKVPMTAEGLKAVRVLSEKGIDTNVTLVFSANQALLAARSGATYVSPFLGRLDDIGRDGVELVEQMALMFERHNIKTEIIAASARHPQHVTQSALVGAHIATLPYKVFKQMLGHPLTDKGLDAFLADWEKYKHNQSK